MIRKKGFTFVELSIVVAILGLIFVLAYPSYRVSKRTNLLYSQARMLSMDIRWMQELSRAHQSDTGLKITDPQKYEIYKGNALIKTVSMDSGVMIVDGPEHIFCDEKKGFQGEVSLVLSNAHEEIQVSANTSGKVDVKWIS